ncbi:MAG TPA: hypothetical protein VFN75_10050 [Pseudonocardiaceae bacterium]|nr:hypothetical protein [Pseudonocardiaceae bacterium]
MTERVGGPGGPTPFGAERNPARVVGFSDADIAFLPFAAAVLADAFRDGQRQRTAVVWQPFCLNAICWYALPIGGEITRARSRRDGSSQA